MSPELSSQLNLAGTQVLLDDVTLTQWLSWIGADLTAIGAELTAWFSGWVGLCVTAALLLSAAVTGAQRR